MTTATNTELLTVGELLRLYSRGVRGELIRGVLHETVPTGQQHGEIVANLVATLGNFVKPRRLGRLTASDAGVWLERDPDTVRAPDVAFFSVEKVPPGLRVPGYSETAPDLVAEIVSHGDSRPEVRDKAWMWLSHGVRLVWVGIPRSVPSTCTNPVGPYLRSPRTPSSTARMCYPASPAP